MIIYSNIPHWKSIGSRAEQNHTQQGVCHEMDLAGLGLLVMKIYALLQMLVC